MKLKVNGIDVDLRIIIILFLIYVLKAYYMYNIILCRMEVTSVSDVQIKLSKLLVFLDLSIQVYKMVIIESFPHLRTK